MAGRPTKYKEEYSEQVEKLCRLGATDQEIADFFNVATSTLNLWKLNHPEFSESLKKGKIESDMVIADKLYERAKGCVVTIQQAHKVKIGKYEEEVRVVDLKQELPPDTTAMIFWLKNRRPKEWRDKPEVDINIDADKSITVKFA